MDKKKKEKNARKAKSVSGLGSAAASASISTQQSSGGASHPASVVVSGPSASTSSMGATRSGRSFRASVLERLSHYSVQDRSSGTSGHEADHGAGSSKLGTGSSKLGPIESKHRAGSPGPGIGSSSHTAGSSGCRSLRSQSAGMAPEFPGAGAVSELSLQPASGGGTASGSGTSGIRRSPRSGRFVPSLPTILEKPKRKGKEKTKKK